MEPLTADFPFARSLIVVRSARTIKKTGQTSTESRYYLSSAPPQEHRPERWLDLIRGHWGGVEVRNHWRRDALMGEDRSRSRNANLLANVAVIRSALLALLAQHHPDQPLPQLREQFHSRPGHCLNLLNS
jgi:predicted transposase YbfD/YdcC